MTHHFLFGYREDHQFKMGYQWGDEFFALDPEGIPSFTWLLQNISATHLLSTLQNACSHRLGQLTAPTLHHFFDQQPVWAAGVTYKISEEARERESDHSTIYTRVYHAERPELFLKALGYNVVSAGDMVGIRADANWSVPEPELTIILNSRLEVFGFTIGNDMSSRDIEGANPLYLPQAKVYDQACALGPRLWLLPGAEAWPELTIHISIEREGARVFDGETSTQRLNRTLPELVQFLGRSQSFPYGVVLMTGTGIVPSDEFTLQEGDTVRISVPPIGELVNSVQLIH